MRMYTMGVKVPKLGSIQDRILKQYLSKEAQKEAKKTQLIAMFTANAVDFNSPGAENEWGSKIKKIWNQYLALEYGVEMTAETEKEAMLTEFYVNTVKNLSVKLSLVNGKHVVSGLDEILPPEQRVELQESRVDRPFIKPAAKPAKPVKKQK